MLPCLPLISLLLLFLIFQNSGKDWRAAVLSAAVVLGVLVTAFTEILSLFRFLTLSSVLILWLITAMTLGFIYYRLLKKGKRSLNFPNRSKLTPVSLVLLGGVVFITTIVGLIAWVAPPNTWDSMTYHMSRVVHWIQNQSVTHYPTYNLPQLFHPPFAEFGILHLQILSGGDRFANFVQWFSMVGSIIGVSLIAKELGANVRGQVFAAVFCATIPMGILQASSTQNDYIVGFWLVCLAYYVLLAVNLKTKHNPFFFIGASLGLAILTKSSGYIYAFPFMVWFGLFKIKRLGWKAWKPFSIVVLLFISLNINHYLRNLDLFGSIIAAPDNFAVAYKIEVYSLPTFFSNILRNLAIHADIVRNLGLENFITPTTGIVNKVLNIIHALIGVDISDPRTTAGSYSVPGLSFDENTAGNPLHFFIILASLGYFLVQKLLRKNKYLLGYLLAIIAGFLLLCLLLKIQTYHSRHHLSLFVLMSAFVGVVLSKISKYWIANTIAVLLIVTSLPWVFNNKWRPITAETNIFNSSRVEQYFFNRPQLQNPYVGAVNFVRSKECFNIGLSIGTGISVGNHYWEYPLWPLLNKDSTKTVRIEHINPQNVSNSKSQNYPHNTFIPCAIISVREKNLKEEQNKELVTKTGTYVQAWSVESGYISVLLKDE